MTLCGIFGIELSWCSKKPIEFINKTAGKITLVYVDLPWVKELFTNFDPNDLNKPFLAGNWGYPYTFADYINFFRVLHQEGIKVVFTEEAYTSKASFYDNDPLPKYGDEIPEFSGKRKHRGLYVCQDCGTVLNADVNASRNILKKGVPKSSWIGNRGSLNLPAVLQIA